MTRIAECNVKKTLGLDNVLELLNQLNWKGPHPQASCLVRLPVLLSLAAGLGQKRSMIPCSRFPERPLRACPLLSVKLPNSGKAAHSPQGSLQEPVVLCTANEEGTAGLAGVRQTGA